MDWLVGNGNKLGMMIGVSCGARNNRLIGPLKNIAFFLICGSIILGVGTSYAAKMHSTKI